MAMYIHKCDICKNEIAEGKDAIIAGIGFDRKEFCGDCGRPITRFLLRNKLITGDKILKFHNIAL